MASLLRIPEKRKHDPERKGLTVKLSMPRETNLGEDSLLEGELDNTIPGRITGWANFRGIDSSDIADPVRPLIMFDLTGDLPSEIKGTKICFARRQYSDQDDCYPKIYLSLIQTGQADSYIDEECFKLDWVGPDGYVVFPIHVNRIQVIVPLDVWRDMKMLADE